jgi:hypothetical protein
MTKRTSKPAKRPWRPRARTAWMPGTNPWSKSTPARIIPEADYQRLLEMAGLKHKPTKPRTGSR